MDLTEALKALDKYVFERMQEPRIPYVSVSLESVGEAIKAIKKIHSVYNIAQLLDELKKQLETETKLRIYGGLEKETEVI